MKFNHLNVPTHWQNYWTRYPEGHTILEALLSWVKQVDDMVDSHNQNQTIIERFGERLDDFIKQFSTDMQQTIVSILSEWQTSGFLEVIIAEALQTEFDGYKTLNEADKLTIRQDISNLLTDFGTLSESQDTDRSNFELFKSAQEQTNSDQLDKNSNFLKRFDNITVDITQPPYNVPTDPTIDATDALQNAFDNVPIRSKVLLPKGTYTITKPIVISRDLTIEGSGAGENGGTLIDVKFSVQYSDNYAFIMKSTAKNGRLRNIYIRNSSVDISGVFGIGNTENEPALTHYEFYNIWSVGFTAGFNFYNIYLSTFKACYAVNGYYGFRFVGHSTSLVFEKCYANKNTDNWYIVNIIYSTFISCASDAASRYGYFVSGVDAVSFIACGAEGCSRTGIYLDGTNAVTIQSFFAVGCGASTALGVGASGHVEPTNKGTVINGFYENNIAPTSPRTSSLVVTSADNTSLVSGAVVTKGVYTTPNVTLNGQRRNNIKPATGTHQVGDFVFNTGVDNTVLGWKCVTAGTPGVWVVVNV